VPEWVRGVGRSPRPAICNEQEHLVAGVRQECAASARIEADPVTTAATDFAIATKRLAQKATTTVVTLADAPVRDACESGPRSSPDFTDLCSRGRGRAADPTGSFAIARC
jgi:hypothetical protein